jgi:phosphate-selective porin OprO and OprP
MAASSRQIRSRYGVEVGGAWEIAGRVSTMNLNDQLGTTNGAAGGQQTIYSAGLNWYVNSNIRFMFDYLHGNIAKQVSPTNTADSGAKFDAFAMRTQVAF